MNLHGWIVSVTPGEVQEVEAGGFCNVTWVMYETAKEGVENVEKQLPKEWEYDIVTFGFCDDMVAYTSLHGICCFRLLNKPEGQQYAPVRLGKHMVDTEFVLCGYIDGQAVPLHTEMQAHEVISWFISKQGHWNEAYSEQSDGKAETKAGTEKTGLSPWPTQRRSRPTLH